MQGETSLQWQDPPASDAAPIEITFTIGDSKFFGLLIDDPNDAQAGYDTIALARSRSGKELIAKLKPASASAAGEFFWSEPVAVKTAAIKTPEFIFACSISSRTAAIFLCTTRGPCAICRCPRRQSTPVPRCERLSVMERVFFTSKAAWATPLPNGGSGGAEARYLETVIFAQHQLMETNRWALENLPWDIYLAYTPFPDEAEHVWRGFLDSTLSTYQRDIAERLRPFLEKVYASADEHLGFLLSKRPEGAYFALISDHGMQGVNKRVALNQALQQGGLLSLDDQGRVDLGKTAVLYPSVNNGYLLINSKDRKGGIVAPEERAEVVRKTRELLFSIRDGERPGGHCGLRCRMGWRGTGDRRRSRRRPLHRARARLRL